MTTYYRLGLCILLILTGMVEATADAKDRPFNHRVSKAYAECSIIYATMSQLMAKTDAGKAKRFLDDQLYLTKIAKRVIAEDEGDNAANNMYSKNAKVAISTITKMIKEDPKSALPHLQTIIRHCKKAISNPKEFVTLIADADQAANSIFLRPININVDKLTKIMSSGKAQGSAIDRLSCKPPRLDITLNKEELVMRGDNICPSKDEAECDANSSWRTIPQHFSSLLPNHKLLMYGHRNEVEQGKTKKLINACLEKI